MANEPQTPALSITDAWVREAPPGVPTLAAYMIITNQSDEPVIITGASSSAATMTELHQVEIVDDVMQMRKMPDQVLEPGQSLELRSGGSHVMLMGVSQSFTQGDHVEIELQLKNKPAVKVLTAVKKAP